MKAGQAGWCICPSHTGYLWQLWDFVFITQDPLCEHTSILLSWRRAPNLRSQRLPDCFLWDCSCWRLLLLPGKGIQCLKQRWKGCKAPYRGLVWEVDQMCFVRYWGLCQVCSDLAGGAGEIACSDSKLMIQRRIKYKRELTGAGERRKLIAQEKAGT